MSARLDEIEKRVDRLETLEYGTLSFPSGGGLGIVCDTTVTVPTFSVTCLIPPGRRHLLAIVAAGDDSTSIPGNTPAPKLRVTINAIVTGYQYATRQERQLIVGDSQATSLGVGAAYWEAIPASRRQWFPTIFKQQCSWIMVLPDPDRMIGVFDSIDAGWIGGSRETSNGPLVLGLGENAVLGGGFNPTDAAITSITWTRPGAFPFLPWSRFTVYGL